jgi:FG-GAP-like repeat/Fibronectin type III domain
MKTPKTFNSPLRLSVRALVAAITILFTFLASATTFAQTGNLTTKVEARLDSNSISKGDAKARTDSRALKATAQLNAPQGPEVAGNYTFTTATNASLTDMSSGTTQLLAANIDDTASALTSIGFDFFFQGARFTQFSINENGLLRLGAAAQASTPYKPLAQLNIPLITAYGADQRTHAGDGKVHFKVTGSAPNRVLTVEWLNNQANFNTGGTADLTYQIRLYETTGVIEFVYGSMTMSTLGAADTNSRDPHIGFSSSNVAGTVGSVTAAQSGTPAPTFNGASNDPVENLYTAGAITVLTSAAQGSRRSFTFTPPTPTAPTALNFTGVTQLAMTLNWTDSPDETIYAIYRSTDGINFTFDGTAAQNATSYSASNLSPGVNYTWQVCAVSEGGLSTALSGSQTTNAAGNISSTATGGNWSAAGTWVGGVVPGAGDNVTIADGSTVTIDTAATALSVTVGTGGAAALLQYESTTARTLTVGQAVAVATNGILQSATTGTVTTHLLSVGGDLTNNGTIDFSTNSNTAGAGITFTGATDAAFTLGGSSTTDFKQTAGVTLNKGTNNTPVLTFTPGGTITVLGANAVGFLTITTGTFKLSGTNAFSNPVFNTTAYAIPAAGGFWMNNANATVAGLNGSPTVTGMFRMSQGTFNVGTATGNSMGFATGANINVEGGAINSTGRFGVAASANVITYNQSGGTITVCTIGNASTTLASFDLGTGTGTTNITGGTIVVQLANTGGSGPRDFRNQSGLTGTTTVTGGTVQLGNAASGAAKAFTIAGVLPNLVIDNSSAGHSATFNAPAVFNNVTRNITINTGNTLSIGNNVFLMNGTTLTNNGTLTANGASSNFVWFLTTAPQTYTGTGNVTAPVTNFAIQSDMGLTIDPAVSNIVVTNIRLFSGSLINSNKITLGNGGATGSVVQIGNTTTPTAAGTFDVPFTFNLGTAGQTLSYLRTGAARNTGPEINPSRTVTTLTIDPNNFDVNLVGDLTVTGVTTITTGNFNIGANTLTITNAIAGATPTGLKGGPTSSLVINGTTASNIPNSITQLNNFTLNNAGGSTLQTSLTVNGALSLTAGALSIGANTLTLNGAINQTAGTLTGGATSSIVVGGTGAAATLPAVAGGLQNLTLNRANGLSLGAALSLGNALNLTNGTLNNSINNVTLANGATITRNMGAIAAAPVFGTSVNLSYVGSTPTTTGPEIPASPTALNNLSVDNVGGVTLGSSPNVNGQLSLTNGVLTTNANAVVVRAGGTVARTNGYVDGNLARTFTAPGVLTYDLGAGGVYSPVNVDAAALSLPQAALTVKAVNSSLSGLPAAQSLQRHWAFSSSAVTSATLQFAYAQSDVPMTANEAQFRITRKRSVDQRFTFPNGLTDNVDEGLDMATTATDVTMPDRGGFYTLAQLDAPGVKTGDARSAELFDFDGNDGRTDVAIWNGTSGDWTIINSVTSATRVQADWGKDALGDKLVPGDYDGDGRTDTAVFRPDEGNWYIVRSSNGSVLLQNWGATGDKPVVGDFNGDGKTDYAVFRISEGNWYILNNGGASSVTGWGTTGDKPVAADYDGDGLTDIAVFRASEGNWYIRQSSGGTIVQNWGVGSDVLVPGDYDGDGRADIAVWRPDEANWYIRNSSDGSTTVRNWGVSSGGDIPVPGDYDRDGRTDVAIFRQSDSNFYILRSSDGNALSNLFSGAGDVPAASAPNIP